MPMPLVKPEPEATEQPQVQAAPTSTEVVAQSTKIALLVAQVAERPRIPRTPGRAPNRDEIVAEAAEARMSQFAGPASMDPTARAMGMGRSTGRPPRLSGSEGSDDEGVVDGMVQRATNGNLDAEDMDDYPHMLKGRKGCKNNVKNDVNNGHSVC
jgi:hypothetical protein